VNEREAVGIDASIEGGFVHQSADGEVSHHQAMELLFHQVRRLGARHDPRSPEVGFKFVHIRLDLPVLVVQGHQFHRRGLARVQDGGDPAVEGPGPRDAFQFVLDDPDGDRSRVLAPVPGGRIDAAQVRSVRQALVTGRDRVFFRSPQQVRALRRRPFPQPEAKEIAVGKAR